jgi:hypothetical protein
MKRLMVNLAAVAAVAAAVAADAPAAHAAPIKECGTWDGSSWTYKPFQGFQASLTTRNVPCPVARRMYRRYKGTDSFFPEWNCREINRYEEFDVRCTASHGRVVRWVGGV